MPMDRTKYPSNWDAIATAIKDAAGWKCEECGLEHGRVIVRSQGNPAVWRDATPDDLAFWRTTVIMTVHHAGVDKPDGTPGDPDDKLDCRPENLKCLCQRCHLLADQDAHIRRSMQTKALKERTAQQQAGQGELF